MRISFIFILITYISSSYAQNLKNWDSLHAAFQVQIKTNFSDAEQTALKQKQQLENLGKVSYKIQTYFNLCEIYFSKRQLKKAEYYAQEALKYSRDSKNDLFVCKALNRLADICDTKGNYTQGLIYVEEVNLIAKRNDLFEKLGASYLIKSSIYDRRFEKERALEFIDTAIVLGKRHGFLTLQMKAFNQKRLSNNKKDSAIFYFKKALRIALNTNNKLYQGLINNNMAYFYRNTENYEEQIKHLKIAEQLSSEVGDNTTLHYVHLNFGHYYDDLDNTSKAITHYKIAKDSFGKYVDHHQIAYVNFMLAGVYYHIEDYKTAFEYQDEYIALADSILGIKKAREFEELRTQYEVEKKENQITLLQKETELAETRRRWIIASALILILPFIGLFIFYRQRAKNQQKIRAQELVMHQKETQRLQKEQELVAIKAQIEGQNRERHRIAKELHDGVGGQLASVTIGLSHFNSDLKNEAIDNIQNTLNKTFSELRSLSHSLSDTFINEKTLETLVFELKQNYEKQNAFNVEISIYPEDSLTNIDFNVSFWGKIPRL